MRKRRGVLSNVLSLFKVAYSYYYLDKILEVCPNTESSIERLAQALDLFRFDTASVFIAEKKDFLFHFDLPFVAQIPDGNICVLARNKDKDILYIQKGKNQTMQIDAFCDKWTGLALIIEKNQHTKEPSYTQHCIKDIFSRIINFTLCSILCIGLFYAFINVQIDNIQSFLSLFLSFIALFICYLLTEKQIGEENVITHKFCVSFVQRDGCNAVLSTDAAKIGYTISWSEIGLGFFVSNIILLMLSDLYYPYVIALNYLTLPFSVWSILYQRLVVKQWCPLCITTQFVLWTLCLLNIPLISRSMSWNYSLELASFVVLVYMFFIVIAHKVVFFISTMKKQQLQCRSYSEFRSNQDVFDALLKKEPFYDVVITQSSVLFGNPDAETKITMVINPFCTHCAKTYQDIFEYNILSSPNYSIQYIFESYKADLHVIDQLLVELYKRVGEEQMKEILAVWFLEGIYNPRKFTERYWAKEISSETVKECKRHWDWVEKNRIIKTPIILINGYKLPQVYNIQDLPFLISSNDVILGKIN